MATASVTYTFVNNTSADASEVNTNFTNLVTFLNNSVLHVDGSKAMTADLDVGSNKVVNVATPEADTDAATKAYVDDVEDQLSSAWTSVTKVNSWANVSGFTALRYRKIGDLVHLYGACENGSAVTIGTLPVGFRPASSVLGVGIRTTTGSTGAVTINSSGVITASTSGTTEFHVNLFFEAA